MSVIINSRDCTREYASECLRKIHETAKLDPARPRYHFCPMAGWMNDPNGGIFVEGEYHLFYLQDPFDPEGISGAVLEDGSVLQGDAKPNRFWGHMKTRDFITWDHLPAALIPDREHGEIKPISGSVVKRRDGSYFMAFTSVRTGMQRYSQWGAFSVDGLVTWVRTADELLKPPMDLKIEGDWRDPYLFCFEGRNYMLVGASDSENSMLLLYEAKDEDLLEWDYKGIFFSKPKQEIRFFECPRIFRTGGRMVLIFSPYKQVQYYIGTFLPEEGRFQMENGGYLDQERIPYATVDVQDENETIYLLSWAPGWFSGKKLSFGAWNGCVTIPRRIWVDREDNVIQRPCGQMEKLREEKLLEFFCNGRTISLEDLPLQLEFILQAETFSKEGWKIQFCDAESGACIQEVELSEGNYLIEGKRMKAVGAGIDFHCYCDGFLWEYFLDGGRSVITTALEKVPEFLKIRLFSTGEPVGGTQAIRGIIWKIMDAKFHDCMI